MPTTRVLFLAGMGRSGTTLLERAIAELGAVQPLGEVVHLWQRGIVDDDLCGCGEPFRRCPFWTQVGEAAFGGWDRVDVERVQQLRGAVDRVRHIPRLLRRRREPADAAAAREYAGYYARLYHAAREVSGAPVVVDSSKQVSLAYCLAGQPGIDLRVLHCVRDSRGVAYSWTKEVVRPETHDAALMPRYSPLTMSTQWTAHNVGVAALPHLGVPMLRIKYEQFVCRPRETLRRVAEFAGLEPNGTPVVDDDHLVLSRSHSAAGNPMRFQPGRIQLRLDDEWRTKLPVRQRRLVTGLTFPLLARYGYLPPWRARGSS
jgi:hypothetical protein